MCTLTAGGEREGVLNHSNEMNKEFSKNSLSVYGVTSKLAVIICCGNPQCKDLCDRWFFHGSARPVAEEKGMSPPSRSGITKKDIQPLVLQQPTIAALDLSGIREEDSLDGNHLYGGGLTPCSSHSPARNRLSSHSAENSPHYLEADAHSFSSSRKSSVCSSTADNRYRPPLSPAPPLIDMRPIEFWACTSRESVQPPRSPRHSTRLSSESEICMQGIRVNLYDGAAAASAAPDAISEELHTTNSNGTMTFGEGSGGNEASSCNLGRIHLGVQYDINASCLYVRVIEARDLPPPNSRDDMGRRCDVTRSNSYARVRLLPDRKTSYQTSVQRKTQNPIWEEQFSFAVPFSEVQDKSVEVFVKDFDKYSRHYLIGCTTLALDSFNILKGTHVWKQLESCSKDPNELGELQLALNFLPAAGRLNVDIISAKQLLQTDLSGGSDPFVKVSLFIADKMVKTKRTSTICHTIDPIFNESLSFNVSSDQIEDCTLVVSVWDHNSKSRDELIGRILLGRQSSGSEESGHWARLLKGGSYRSPSAQWHVLRTREECDSRCSLSLVVQ